MAISSVPVINVAPCSIARDNIDEENLPELAASLYEAFATNGIAILRNHGIATETFANSFRTARDFFQLSDENKLPYAMPDDDRCGLGYIAINHKTKSYRSFRSVRETYRYNPGAMNVQLPDGIVPGFREANAGLYHDMARLVLRLLKPLSIALDVDEHIFTDTFQRMGKPGNPTMLLHSLYPLEAQKADDNAIKLSQHMDNDALSFLVTNDPGLQFQDQSGEWIDVPPTGDDILILIGEQMQMWTENKFKGLVHRVVFSQSWDKTTHRQSCGYFAYPDSQCIISGMYGNNTYPPFNSEEFYLKRLKSYDDT